MDAPLPLTNREREKISVEFGVAAGDNLPIKSECIEVGDSSFLCDIIVG